MLRTLLGWDLMGFRLRVRNRFLSQWERLQVRGVSWHQLASAHLQLREPCRLPPRQRLNRSHFLQLLSPTLSRVRDRQCRSNLLCPHTRSRLGVNRGRYSKRVPYQP